ncbi:MAG: peptidase domain protein [Deltaproteobacteria bacterium]|nr:peptidase domain protein [Deltaproteobacteria bacterium]
MTRSRALAAGVAIVLFAAGCAGLGAKPAWEQLPPPIVEGPVVPQSRLHRAQLDDGVTVLVLEDHSLPRLALGVITRRGAGSESLEQAGIASLTLDVMKRGAGKRDALALARAVEEMGASLSASAGWDSASVGVAGLSEDSKRLFDVLADVVHRPRFDPGEVARARAEQLASFEQEKDEPQALAGKQLARMLYGGHRYGVSADGEPASVAKLDARALRAFHARLFTPAQSIVYVVGDVTAEAALEQVRAHFGDWPAGAGLERGTPAPDPTPASRRVVIVDRPDLAQAMLAIGHEGISRRDPERVAADLMNTVLGGGGFLSRLMTRVRADEGLAYSVGSGFALRWYPGPFLVSTSTRVAEAGRVVEIALAEMDGMHSRPPSAAELRLVKSFSAGRFVLGLETSSAIAGSLVDLDVYGLPPDSLDTYRTRVQAVTQDDVAAAASRLLHPDRVAIVAVGPAASLRPQLERFGPVEVVEP